MSHGGEHHLDIEPLNRISSNGYPNNILKIRIAIRVGVASIITQVM